MAGIDPAFQRRAAQAPPHQQPTLLDQLEAEELGPAARAQRQVAVETLEQLEHRFPEWRDWDLSKLRSDLEQKKLRLLPLASQLPDRGHKHHELQARQERYIQLRELSEQLQKGREQQQQQQDVVSAERSKAWLQQANANQQEAREQAVEMEGPRQVQPKPLGPTSMRSRNFSELSYSNDGKAPASNAPLASRGAVGQLTKRHTTLLQPSKPSVQRKQQQPQRQGGHTRHQQQQQAPDRAFECPLCGSSLPSGRKPKPVTKKDTGEDLWVCFTCVENNRDLLQSAVPNRRQATLEESVGGHHQQQQCGGPSQRAATKQQPGRAPLNLKPVPASSFHSHLASAPNSSMFVGSGNDGTGPSGSCRRPKRGKGQQRGGGNEDADWVPVGEAALQQQADLHDESDDDIEWDGGRKRPRNQQWRGGQRKRGSSQDQAEPVCIDLLSDEDGTDEQGLAGASAAVDDAPTLPERPMRATAWRSTSNRFKGLKCLYPPTGGPGAVEVTALDLTRLDADEFLNDTVIDFYIRWLQDQLPPEVMNRCYFFNTFFFKKLMEEHGGVLSPELEEWAKKEGLTKGKLQALCNHQKVKNWTKDVDLFSKDYIFVPVHEALHWSLMVVCHPGVVMSPKDQMVVGQKTPCILHLDSLSGSHQSNAIVNKLRLYLNYEWHIKSLPDAPDSLPKRWAEAHPDQTRSWMPSHFPYKVPKVPTQDNHCDCGLFVCSYIEYFTHKLPPVIHVPDIDKLNKEYSRTNRDLFEGTDDCIPGLLTQKWFDSGNPSHLRHLIRRLILELMAEQHGLWNRDTNEWMKGDEMADELKRELLQLRQLSEAYVPPVAWEPTSLANKRYRLLALRRREQEAAARESEKKAQRSQRQKAAAKGPAALGRQVDREAVARAAENRLQDGSQRLAADELFAGLSGVAAQRDSADDDSFFEQLPGQQPPGRQHNQQQQQQLPSTEEEEQFEQQAEDLEDLVDDTAEKSQEGGGDSDFGVFLDDDAEEAPEGQQGAAAAGTAGDSLDERRLSASPELAPLPEVEQQPGPQNSLPGMGGSRLPGRRSDQARQHQGQRRQQVVSSAGEDVVGALQPGRPSTSGARQQQQEEDAAVPGNKRQRKQPQAQQHGVVVPADSPAATVHSKSSTEDVGGDDEESNVNIEGEQRAAGAKQQVERQSAGGRYWEGGAQRQGAAPLPAGPQQQQQNVGQGNGPATTTKNVENASGRGGAGVGVPIPSTEADAAPVVVAGTFSPLEEHEEPQAGYETEEAEIISLGDSLVGALSQQPGGQQQLVEDDGPLPVAAGVVGGTVSVWGSGSGMVSQQMAELHLDPGAPAVPAGPAGAAARLPPAQAAALQLQARQERLRQEQQAAEAAPAEAAAFAEVHDLTMEDAGPLEEPLPAVTAQPLPRKLEQQSTAAATLHGQAAGAPRQERCDGSGGSQLHPAPSPPLPPPPQRQPQEQLQQFSRRKRKVSDPVRRVVPSEHGVGLPTAAQQQYPPDELGQQEQHNLPQQVQPSQQQQAPAWNPHLLASSNHNAAAMAGGSAQQQAGTQGAKRQPVSLRATTKPEQIVSSAALKLVKNCSADQRPLAAAPGFSSLDSIGQPREHDPRFAVSAVQQQPVHRGSPRMTPLLSVEHPAAAAAYGSQPDVRLAAHVAAENAVAEAYGNMKQQAISAHGGVTTGHEGTSSLAPDDLRMMLEHITAVPSLNGQEVRQAGAAVGQSMKRLSAKRKSVEQQALLRQGRSAPPPLQQQADAAVDLVSDVD